MKTNEELRERLEMLDHESLVDLYKKIFTPKDLSKSEIVDSIVTEWARMGEHRRRVDEAASVI